MPTTAGPELLGQRFQARLVAALAVELDGQRDEAGVGGDACQLRPFEHCQIWPIRRLQYGRGTGDIVAKHAGPGEISEGRQVAAIPADSLGEPGICTLKSGGSEIGVARPIKHDGQQLGTRQRSDRRR